MLLADNIPEAARTCYLALKATIKSHINNDLDDDGKEHKFTSYWLKTLLFYEIERKEPTFWDNGIVEEELFNTLLDAVIYSVQAKYCPHFWIEGVNLMIDAKEDDFRFWEVKLQEIKTNPVKYIASEWLEWNRYNDFIIKGQIGCKAGLFPFTFHFSHVIF